VDRSQSVPGRVRRTRALAVSDAASGALPVLLAGGRVGPAQGPAVVAAAVPPAAAAPPEAALLVHRAHRHGHQLDARTQNHPQRHLQLHHGALSLLSGQPAGLAELHQAQPQPQRVLRQGAQGEGRARKRLLLVARPALHRHVRTRKLQVGQPFFAKENGVILVLKLFMKFW
jgi:hypothetical protein